MQIRSRPGRDITASVPELAPLAALGIDVVLDGELIAGVGRLGDLYRLSGRLAGGGRLGPCEPVTFAAFDVLWLDGADLTRRPYLGRRRILEQLPLDAAPASVVPRYLGEDADDLLAASEAQDLEGVVLKRLGSLCRPGRRSTDWRKIECPAWADHAERRRLSRAR